MSGRQQSGRPLMWIGVAVVILILVAGMLFTPGSPFRRFSVSVPAGGVIDTEISDILLCNDTQCLITGRVTALDNFGPEVDASRPFTLSASLYDGGGNFLDVHTIVLSQGVEGAAVAQKFITRLASPRSVTRTLTWSFTGFAPGGLDDTGSITRIVEIPALPGASPSPVPEPPPVTYTPTPAPASWFATPSPTPMFTPRPECAQGAAQCSSQYAEACVDGFWQVNEQQGIRGYCPDGCSRGICLEPTPEPTSKITPAPLAPSTPRVPIVGGESPMEARGPPRPPGFEAVFAIAGLLAVAYIVGRRRR